MEDAAIMLTRPSHGTIVETEKGETTCVSRGVVAKTPYFLETISCLALILGETGDSGHSPCLDDSGKKTTIPNKFRESLRRVSRIEFRADNGRFR